MYGRLKLTRQADPRVKDNLHIRARSEAERQIIGDLKRLAVQDEIELADLIFEGITLMFQAHHFPPGNPQLQLTAFQKEQPKIDNNLCACGRPIEVTYGLWESKTPHKACKLCYNKLPRHKIQYYRLKKDEHK